MQEQIRKLRIKAGLTQIQLAEQLGYKGLSIVAMWESGERKVPSDKIPALASVLGCEIKDLFEGQAEDTA